MASRFLISIAVALLIASCAGVPTTGEPIQRTLLQRTEYPDGTVIQLMRITAAPHAALSRHTHPGVETSYILEGEVELTIDGRPTVTLQAGDSFAIPAGAVHGGKAGPRGATLIGTFVVDKNKPLTAPAP